MGYFNVQFYLDKISFKYEDLIKKQIEDEFLVFDYESLE